jgi:Tfp pilus assembly protein PilN
VSQQINLFNPIFLKKKKHFSAVTMAQALGLILLGSLAVAGYARWQLAALEASAVETEQQLKSTKAQVAKVTANYAPRQKSKALEEEIQRMEVELKSRQQAFEIVQRGSLGNSKGYAEYLYALSRQVVDGLWLTGFRIEGNEIELRGRSLKPDLVPEFIKRLKHEPIMQGKSFARLAMETPAGEPVPDEGAANNAATPKRRTLAEYIEFVLRSSDVLPEQAKAMGALKDTFGIGGGSVK